MKMKAAAIQEDSIYVVGCGAQAAVGRSVLAAAAAVRCGLSAAEDHPFMIDKHGEPMVVCRAKWLSDTLPVGDRVVALAVAAAREAWSPLAAQSAAQRRRLRVHLALSAESLADEAQRRDIVASFAREIGLGGEGGAAEVHSVSGGHAGALLALESAAGELRRGEAQLCLVAGADSWLDPARLRAIDDADRLHSIHQSWGFIPGEGAGSCVIATGAVVRRLGLTPLAELLSAATARESKLMGTRTVCIGEGLTAAFRGALEGRPRVSHCYCDFNGETYRADEYGFAICRTSEHFKDAGSFTAGAECWGDVGAASGALALTLAVAAWARGHAAGPVSLIFCSSAGGPLRGAALLKQWPCEASF